MAGRETYLEHLLKMKKSSYKSRAADVQLYFAEEAEKEAKKVAKEKAEEKEDYGNDEDTEKEEKKVHKTESDVKDGKGKKELAEEKDEKDEKDEDKKDEKELAEDGEVPAHVKKYFGEHIKSLEDRLHDLEETMGDNLEMSAKKRK